MILVYICGVRGIIVTIVENKLCDLSSNAERAYKITNTDNTPKKDTNATILPRENGLIKLGVSTNLGEGKPWIQNCLTPL